MKREIRKCLVNRDFEGIRALAEKRKLVLSRLLALTFDPDEAIRWGAVEGLGIASSVWVEKDIESVREFCRRLLWLVNDESGGVGWFVPQALGAILGENHDSLSEFIPSLLTVLDVENEKPILLGMLWALGRIGPIGDDYVTDARDRIRPHLSSADPDIQAVAIKSDRQLRGGGGESE